MGEIKDELSWLEHWYQEQCDGEWEHACGVTVETLDNPGWLVTIDLRGVEPEAVASTRVVSVLGEPPSEMNGNKGGAVWMTCKVESGKFIGAGDPSQLRAILAQFKSFIEARAT
jgi:hypothetical protein